MIVGVYLSSQTNFPALEIASPFFEGVGNCFSSFFILTFGSWGLDTLDDNPDFWGKVSGLKIGILPKSLTCCYLTNIPSLVISYAK
jgi:hypothetical protein